MQNIKNFTAVEPAAAWREKFAGTEGELPLCLQSEDGQNWYDCQALFLPDTIKIMYDASGIIRGIIDKPVPARGNTLAVSMFFPLGMSVAEVLSLPGGCSNDGAWMFNGTSVVAVPVDYVALAEKEKTRRLAAATRAIAPLQDAVDLGIATQAETTLLNAWKTYRVDVNRIDTSLAPNITWPLPPA